MKNENLSIEDKLIEISKVITDIKDYSNISLMTGMGGKCLTMFYVAKVFNSEKLYNTSFYMLEKILDKIETNKNTISTYCDGITGIGVLVNHLYKNSFIDFNESDISSSFDDYVINDLRININSKNYDFLHGAIGNGLYLTQRGTSSKIFEAISFLIENLLKDSVESLDKIYWKDSVLELDGVTRININFSLSHGLCSKIMFFLECVKLGIQKDLCVNIIEKCINFLLDNQTNNNYLCNFPSKIYDDGRKEFSERLAWCYGDLGSAYTLFKAGDLFNNKLWLDKGISIARECALRDFKSSGAVDSCICHGTSGICYIMYKIYTKTNDVIFKDSYTNYLEKILTTGITEKSLVDYSFYTQKGWVYNTSLLDGLSGVGIVLQSILKDDCNFNNWDELFFIN